MSIKCKNKLCSGYDTDTDNNCEYLFSDEIGDCQQRKMFNSIDKFMRGYLESPYSGTDIVYYWKKQLKG